MAKEQNIDEGEDAQEAIRLAKDLQATGGGSMPDKVTSGDLADNADHDPRLGETTGDSRMAEAGAGSVPDESAGVKPDGPVEIGDKGTPEVDAQAHFQSPFEGRLAGAPRVSEKQEEPETESEPPDDDPGDIGEQNDGSTPILDRILGLDVAVETAAQGDDQFDKADMDLGRGDPPVHVSYEPEQDPKAEADPIPEVQAEASYEAPPEVYAEAEYEIPEISAEAEWVPEVYAEAEYEEPEEEEYIEPQPEEPPDPMMDF